MFFKNDSFTASRKIPEESIQAPLMHQLIKLNLSLEHIQSTIFANNY